MGRAPENGLSLARAGDTVVAMLFPTGICARGGHCVGRGTYRRRCRIDTALWVAMLPGGHVMFSANDIEMALRLVLALLVGGLIGINRFVRRKAAGLRTHALVALGTAVATVTMVHEPGADAQAISRVVQGLVTGVGFIGAGVILHAGARVQGLTTAASVWVAAILGIACGAGSYLLCVLGLGFSMAILLLGRPIERGAERMLRWLPTEIDAEGEEPEEADDRKRKSD